MIIALAQFNPTVGDFEGNRTRILEMAREAQSGGAEIAVFSELCICGYPPQDLIERPSFAERNQQELIRLVAARSAVGEGIAPVVRRFCVLSVIVLGLIFVPLAATAGPLARLLFGGQAIHSFTATMMFGVVLVGTYTSVFIASPILIYLGVGTGRDALTAPERDNKP